MALIMIIGLASLGVAGDFLLKLSGQATKNNLFLFSLGVLMYVITAFGWYYVMKHIPMGKLGVYYAITTVILLMIIGIFKFGEKITPIDGFALMLAIIAILLLGRFE